MTNQPASKDDTEMGLGRVEAFSDGVFGVAVTLLVLNIQVPHLPDEAEAAALIGELLKQWPSYLGYVTTFLTLGSSWIGHHQMLRYWRRVDRTLQLANILLLIFVTLTPFTTAFLAEYIQQANKVRIATTLYGVVWAIMGLIMSGMWRYARRADFLKPNLDAATIRSATIGFGIGSLIGSFATLVALISPVVGIAIYFLIALAYQAPLLRLLNPNPPKYP